MVRLLSVAGAAAAIFALATSGCDGSAAPLPPLLGATSVSAGYSHTCAVMNDATVKCWGGDAFGQVGDGETTFSIPAPSSVPGLTGVKAVAAGASFTCALKTDGTVDCWGANTSCELGNGCNLSGVGSESGAIDDPNPVAVTGISGPVASLALGAESDGDAGYACAILVGATVECWGWNGLGVDPSATVTVIPPTPVGGLANVLSLALSDYFACALLADGTAACWGEGPLGQPGSTTTSYSVTPLPVSALSGVIGLAAGSFQACALLDTGTVACWGSNSGAQLGDGTLTDSATPVMVSGVSGAVAIAADDYQTCALISDGTVKCWGGDTAMLTPVAVPGLTGALSISLGSQFACALVAGGGIACWGDDGTGQLGTGVAVPPGGDPHAATPVTVVSGSS